MLFDIVFVSLLKSEFYTVTLLINFFQKPSVAFKIQLRLWSMASLFSTIWWLFLLPHLCLSVFRWRFLLPNTVYLQVFEISNLLFFLFWPLSLEPHHLFLYTLMVGQWAILMTLLLHPECVVCCTCASSHFWMHCYAHSNQYLPVFPTGLWVSSL